MTLDADELVRRMKATLALAGYPDADVGLLGTAADGNPKLCLACDQVPPAVAWRALRLAYGFGPCWSCWAPNSGTWDVSLDCLSGNCHHLGPARPPRELPARSEEA